MDGFDFSKGDEFLYFIGDRVVKYFADADITDRRCARAQDLSPYCPEIIDQRGNLYAYRKIEGQTLYTVLNQPRLKAFLDWMENKVWSPKRLSPQEAGEFKSACERFYKQKTLARIERFFAKSGIKDGTTVVNGVEVPSVESLLTGFDWSTLVNGVPSLIHGDLQFDNILVPAPGAHEEPFVLLDWRQDFGGF